MRLKLYKIVGGVKVDSQLVLFEHSNTGCVHACSGVTAKITVQKLKDVVQATVPPSRLK